MATTAPPAPTLYASSSTLADVLEKISVALTSRNPETHFLATSAHSSTWLITLAATNPFISNNPIPLPSPRFILHTAITADVAASALVENEVAWLTYIAKHHASVIPVPAVYAYKICDSSSNSTSSSRLGSTPFIAMKYVDGGRLSEIWMSLPKNRKEALAGEIASLIISMAGITFPKIRGMTLSHALGPTVETAKIGHRREGFGHKADFDGGSYELLIDWKVAGSYPLSETLSKPFIAVTEPVDEEANDEVRAWHDRSVALATDLVVERSREPARIELLVGPGNPELRAARVEMLPDGFYAEARERGLGSPLHYMIVDYLDHPVEGEAIGVVGEVGMGK